MIRMLNRAVRVALTGAALLCSATLPALSAGPEAVYPPFTYWDMHLDLGSFYCTVKSGWPLPPPGTWREQFPSPGALHGQSRYVDRDYSNTISKGDSIEATGIGRGVWRVESVTTEFTLEAEGLPTLVVTSDRFYWSCALGTHCSSCAVPAPPCPPTFPVPGDSLFVLTPDFNQILTVGDWIRHNDYFVCFVAPSDSAVLSGPIIPPDSRYRLTDLRCGVWLSWDLPVDARRQSWGWLKGTYHR